MILINSNTRQFNVPGADLVFGVVADSDAERKHFQCPRYVGDGLDLAACFIRINYRNANGKTDFYLVDDMVIDGDNITFSWLLSPKVTEYRGQVKFVMCAVGPDLKLKWHTTQGTGQVMEGLEPDNSHVESQTADVVAQLIAMVEEQTTAVEVVGVDQVAAVKAAAKTAQDSAVAEIEAKRTNSLNSIPADYTALSATVDTLVREAAPGIVCSAEGEVITLNDASNQAFRGLRIFGKSTQDGTPTPGNPVEIVSVEKPVVTVAGKNLLRVTGLPSDINGVVVTTGNDGLISVNGTASSGGGRLNGNCYITLPPGAYSMRLYNAEKGPVAQIAGGVHISDRYTQAIIAKDNADFTITETKSCIVGLHTVEGQSYNQSGYVMITAARDATEYESYKTPQTISVSTPNGLPGIPVSSGGNYTDANGQQWVCDEVDFARGVYVRRIDTISPQSAVKSYNNYAGTNRVVAVCTDASYTEGNVIGAVMCDSLPTVSANDQYSTNKSGISNVYGSIAITIQDITSEDSVVQWLVANPIKIQYALANPVETPLSETELAAYRALHTNKPNTTILNDSGAYMSVDYTADTKLYIDNKIKEALQC